jgi:hypothetical protein
VDTAQLRIVFDSQPSRHGLFPAAPEADVRAVLEAQYEGFAVSAAFTESDKALLSAITVDE